MSACSRRITAIAAASPAVRQIQLQRAPSEVLPFPWTRNGLARRVVLRFQPGRQRRSSVIEEVGRGGGAISVRNDGGGGGAGGGDGKGDDIKERIRPCWYSVGDQRPVGDLVGHGGGEIAGGGGKSADRKAEVLVAAGVTVVLGVGNRVLHKLALVPLKHYPFFLAQLATLGYAKRFHLPLFSYLRL
ncbi:hypothetical protein U1Q18_047663 [Sarracenia purpurea var. burkii]